MKRNETTRPISMVVGHAGMASVLVGLLMTGNAFGASGGLSPTGPASSGTPSVSSASSTTSMQSDIHADRKDIVLDQKISAHLQVDILRNRLALQKALARVDKTRDMLAKLRSDLRTNLKDGDDKSADIRSDKENIRDLRDRMKQEMTMVSALRSEIRKDVRQREALEKDIAKNKKDYKSDVAGQKKPSAPGPSPVVSSNPPAPGIPSSNSSTTAKTSSTSSATGTGKSTASAGSSTSVKTTSSSVSTKSDLVADRNDIAADRKISDSLRIDILKNRLALQQAINKADKTRDSLHKLQSDLRSNMKDKDDHKADILSDRKDVRALKTELKKEQKTIASMRSEIKKDVAQRKAILSDIAKNRKDVSADLENRDLARDKKSVEALEAKISGYRHSLVVDRNKFREVLEQADDGNATSTKLKAAIKSLRAKLSSAVKSLRGARTDLRKDMSHRTLTASSSSSVHVKAGVHPIVHPEDKK